MFLFVMLQ